MSAEYIAKRLQEIDAAIAASLKAEAEAIGKRIAEQAAREREG